MFGKKKPQFKYKIVEQIEGQLMSVRWECTCGAVGRWRSATTTHNKLRRLWSLHKMYVHEVTDATS